MRVAAATTGQVFYDSARDGPIVLGLSGPQAAYLYATNRAALANYVNQTLQQREAALPEGSKVEMQITGWNGLAPNVAQSLNQAWASGEIINPITNEMVQPWSEYPNQIAWSQGDTVIIRTTKAQIQIVWVIVQIAAFVLAAIYVWELLRSARGIASVFAPATSPIPIPGSPPSQGAQGLTTGQKILLVGGAVLIVGVAGYMWWKITLAQAGAAHVTTIVETAPSG